MEKEKYYNTKEVSEMLSMGQEYLRQMIREGKIKAVKVGRRWKIKESEVKRLITGEEGKDA